MDAFTTTTNLVPQNGTTRLLDTLGDKIMTPVVYQNLSGTNRSGPRRRSTTIRVAPDRLRFGGTESTLTGV